MNNNAKNFDRYVFLSTLARNLIEVFIGTVLFKIGFSLHQVIFYYLLVNIFSTVLGVPCTMIAKKYSNKLLSIIGIVFFIILQITLNYVTVNIAYLYLVAFLFAIYRRSYWISRRYYTLQVVDKNNISKNYSKITIINQLGVMTSSYIGSILLDFFDISVVTIISIMILILSVYFLYKLDFKYEKNNIKIKLFDTLKCVPKTSMIHIACYEMQNVLKFFLPLYIFIYVRDTYTTVGLLNLIANLATLIFAYVYGTLINKNKNYLRLSIFLVLIIKVLQVNVVGISLMIISFLEGFLFKMYEQSFNKESLILSKSFDYQNYNYMYEMVQNISRLVVVAICFFFINDIRCMIYFTLCFVALGLLFKFNPNPLYNNSEVVWKEE